MSGGQGSGSGLGRFPYLWKGYNPAGNMAGALAIAIHLEMQVCDQSLVA